MLEMAHENMDMHEYLNYVKGGKVETFNHYYEYYMLKYNLNNK